MFGPSRFHRPRRSPRRAPLGLLVAAVLFAATADALGLVALTVRVHDAYHSGIAVAGLLAAGVLPALLLAPLAGLLVDRVTLRPLLVGAAAGQAVVSAALAATSSLPGLVALSLLLGASFAVSQPAVAKAIPRVAGPDRVQQGNAWQQGATWTGWALGPLLGGALVAVLGTRVPLLFAAAMFATAAIALAVLRMPGAPAPTDPEDGAAGWSWRAGVVLLLRDRTLRVLLGVVAVVVAFTNIATIAEVFLAKDALHAGDAGYGLLIAGWTGGMVLGSVLGSRLPARLLAPSVLVAALVMSAGLLGAAAAPVLGIAVASYAVGGVANGVEVLASRSVLHERTPERLHGRVFAAYFGLMYAADMLATGVGGGLVGLFGARGALLVAAGGAALAGFGGLAAYLRPAAAAGLAESA